MNISMVEVLHNVIDGGAIFKSGNTKDLLLSCEWIHYQHVLRRVSILSQLGFSWSGCCIQFRVFGNYWRCIPVDEVQMKLCHARQGSKTIWDLKMGQKFSSLK
jgi:hypothetical protein